MRLWGITTEIVGFIPKSLVLRSIVLGCISYSNAPTRARGIIKLSYRENYVMVSFFIVITCLTNSALILLKETVYLSVLCHIPLGITDCQ